MIARSPSSESASEPVYADKRERNRMKKRRQRERLYAKGLTATGAPLRNPQMSSRLRNQHPADCPCYDCLWGNQ